MASLEGQSINTSYQGLLKTEANDGLGAAQRRITTGEGTESGLLLTDSYEVRIEGAGSGYGNLTGKLGNLNLVNLDQDGGIFMSDFTVTDQTIITIGTTQAGDSTNFLGAVDFSSATVTGIGDGILQTSGNTALPSGGTVATITDGDGNATGFKLGQDYIAIEPLLGGHIYDVGAENGFYFTSGGVMTSGSWNFSSSTVTGIDTGVQSVVAGTNVTVDNTDPANPIISAAGGGGGGLTGVSTTTQTTHTGADSVDVVFYSLLIPANTFGAGDIVNIKTLLNQDYSGGGWIYNGLWIAPTTAMYSGINVASHESPSDMTWIYDKTLYINTSDGSGLGTSLMGAWAVDQRQNGTSPYSDAAVSSINWTVDQYVNISCFVEGAGSSITLRGLNAVKINA